MPDMAYEDIGLLLDVARNVKKLGRLAQIEFSNYTDLRDTLGRRGTALELRRQVEALYQRPTDERLLVFVSRRLRELDPTDSGDTRKCAIILPTRGIEMVVKWVRYLESMAVTRADATSALGHLVDLKVVTAEMTAGSRGKVYKTYALA